MLIARLAISTTFFINGFMYANWVARLPKIQKVYGLDNGTLGLLLFSLSIGALLAMPFTGWLIIKQGSKKLTSWAAILVCVAVPLIPLIPEITQLMGLFFVLGILTGILDVSMNSQAVLVEQAYQKPIMTSFHALFSIGMALGAGCGALFTELEFTLFQHFLLVGVLSLGLVIWAIGYLIEDGPHESEEKQSVFRLPSRALIGIGVIAFCCMTGEGAMADWSTSYMENISLASPALAPIGLASFSLAMSITRIFGDLLRAKLGDAKLLIINSLVASLGLLLILIISQPLVVIAGLFLVGIGLSTIVPIAYSTAGSSPDLPPGVGLGMVTTVGYAGFLFGPPIIGFLADWFDLRIAMIFVFFLFVAMTALSWANKKPKVS